MNTNAHTNGDAPLRPPCLLFAALAVLFATPGLLFAAPAGHAAEEPVVIPTPPAPDKEWSASVSVEFSNRFLLRGTQQNGDPVILPSANVTWKGLSLSVYQAWDTTHYGKTHYGDRKGELSKCDYALGYSTTVLDGKLTLGGGVFHYTFPGTTLASTTELYASATLNTFLSPSITVYRDVDESKGVYVYPSISHTIKINDKTEVALAANLGWGNRANNSYYYADASGVPLNHDSFLDYGLSVQLNYKVTPAFTLSPFIRHSDYLTHEAREKAKANYGADNSAQLTFGLRATYSF